MTHSGGYNNADNKAEEEGMSNATDATAMTEDGEIDTGKDSNDIFSDSVPGEENSAARNDDAADGNDAGNIKDNNGK